jgi:hypothetical protein
MTGNVRKDGEWAVYDMNARTPDPDNRGRFKPRIHEARMGVAYALAADEPCYMPESDARVFLKDSAFRVLDANDRLVAALDAAQMSRTPPTTLDPDKVVANLAELTDEALLTRVALMPGGYRYTSAAPRDVLIEALISGQTPEDAGSDFDADDLDPRAAAKLLEGV